MQSRLRYLSILFLVLLSTAATAQVYTRRLASGNTSDFNKAGAAGLTGPVARRSVNPVDTRLFAAEDEQRTKLGLPDRLGVDIEMLTDFMQVAGKTVDNDRQISRFRFDVSTAQGLSIMFDSLFLATGAQLFIYNADQTVLIGPVTGQQNGRNFWSDLVTGESLIIELKEPLPVAGQSIVTVAKLIQFYRFVPKFGFNTSSSCEINTACYSGYQTEADGVAMLLTNYSPYTYACTGSMLNNTQQNFRSLLLTAFHCFDFSGDGALQTAERNAAATTQVRFHWESPTCTPTSTDNVYLTLTGATLQAAYVNSDFSLLELNQQVPPSENITYLGWDRNNSNFSSVFGIHHPSADIKKISFSNNATTFVGTVMTTGGNYYTTPGSTHLNVTWNASPNTLGVTEGGSSGSALFNPDRRIVGQLHGGGSLCSAPTAPDQYGRLYTSWTGGGSSATRLSDWLNPAGTAATTTNSVKSQVSGPVTFVSTATFSLNSGSSAITSWVVTGGNGMISPASGSGNIASLTATGSVSGATITFSVNAGQSYPISFAKSFNADGGENFPPSASNIPAQSATVGTPFSYTVPAFTDPEGLPLTYSAAGLPNGLSFNPVTRVINGTPTTSGTFVASITGTDQGNLATSVAFLFTVNCPVTSISAGSVAVCQGQSVNLTASGAAAYLWSTGANTAAINTAPAQTTTYSVTGTTNACISVATVTIQVQSLPSVSINAGATTICQGQLVNLTASGAATYLWSTGANTTGITPAPVQTTTYSVTGILNGCAATASRSIFVQARPAVSVNPGTPLICQGQTVSLTATGAASYLWSTGTNTAAINTAPAQTTTYSVTGTTNGCSSVTTVTVSVLAPPSLSVNIEALTICRGGSVDLRASGANTYLWSTGANTAGITLTPDQTGLYSVTGTTNGCSAIRSVSVLVDDIPVPSAAINARPCEGQPVSITLIGGYTYIWSTGDRGPVLTVTPTISSAYSATVLSRYGCSSLMTIQSGLVKPNPTLDIASGSPSICQGQSISLSAAGATSYVWSTGETRAGIQPSPTQTTTYSVTGTTDGCSSTTTVTVPVRERPVLSLAVSSANICQGQPVSLTAGGADAYVWSTGETKADIQAVPIQTTTYSVSGTTNGCSSVTAVTVTVQTLPGLTINTSAITICQGQPVSLTAGGADSYIWSTGERSARLQSVPIQTTIYSVTGITNGCSSVTAVTVIVQALPSLSVNASSLTICRGQSVSLTAGGAGSYVWSTGGRVADIESAPIQTTTYSVTGTTNGCSSTASVSVFVAAIPLPTAIVGPIPCEGYPLSITVNGGYTYIWSNGDRGPVLTVTPTINSHYSVTAVSQYGCTSQLDFPSRLVRPNPTVSITPDNFSTCPGQSVSLTASGAGSYIWSTGEASAAIQSAPAQTTTYSVTGTTNGCSSTTAVTIAVQPCPLSLSAAVTNCQPGELSLRFVATGGTGAPYEYAGVGVTPWTTQPGVFTIPVFSDTAPLELWVRNTGDPGTIVRYTLPIPACARPLPVTVTIPQTETAAQPLRITGASINCDSRIITLSTTGGSTAPVYQRILFVTNFQPVSQPLTLDYEVFAEQKPVQLQVQQSGMNSAIFVFDYSSQCQSVTTTPPVTQTAVIPQQSCASPAATLGQPLTLSATVNCTGAGGVLSFFPRGGQLQANTVFEFMSPGITGWTTSCTVSVTEADPVLATFVRQRNPVTGEVLAQTSYTLPNPCTSGAGRTALADDSFQVTILGNPTSARQAMVAIAGKAGQQLWLTVTDVQGRIISTRQIDATPWPVQYQAELGSAAGVYLLTVRSIQKRQTFSIIRY